MKKLFIAFGAAAAALAAFLVWRNLPRLRALTDDPIEDDMLDHYLENVPQQPE